MAQLHRPTLLRQVRWSTPGWLHVHACRLHITLYEERICLITCTHILTNLDRAACMLPHRLPDTHRRHVAIRILVPEIQAV